MADKQGTSNGDWYIVRECECSSDDELEDLEEIFDGDTTGSLQSFIDDTNGQDEVDQGLSAALLNRQLLEEADSQLGELKRKYKTPSPTGVNDLSPHLASVSLTPRHRQSKRRLFRRDTEGENEESTSETIQVPVSGQIESQGTTGTDYITCLLKSKNCKQLALCKFKDAMGVSFTDLTKSYVSNKTCSHNWVVAVFGPQVELADSAKLLLKNHCSFFQMNQCYSECGLLLLLLLEFNSAKCRDTLERLMCSMLQVQPMQLLCEPPKTKSVLAALYFYKKGLVGGDNFMHGPYPDWLAKQTVISHCEAAENFSLTAMIQWAYDNEYIEESQIAYYYAQYAEEDANAQAWLKSNCQAKYVKDCSNMVKLYLKQEAKNMTMSQWLYKRCSRVEGEGEWKTILQFLKYQGVNPVVFLTVLKDLLQGRPKKHCVVIWGPPDTGKSYFLHSLISFMGGKVITFMNAKSHFWLQPLGDAKIGLLDDATIACWDYMDMYMRTALDGNLISLDSKFKAPMQMKLPPLLVSTNVNITGDQYPYLKSRVVCFEFSKPFPFDEAGNPLFCLTDLHWKSFFLHLASQLDLDLSEENNGDVGCPLRCLARDNIQPD